MKYTYLSIPLFVGAAFISTVVMAESASHGEGNAPAVSEEKHEIHWGYDGEGKPKNWGKIKAAFKACRLGKYQSPIDINETINADLPILKIYYKDEPLTVINNGHTIQVNYPKGSGFIVDGNRFNLLQFHFHTPSENAINGKRYDMEMHFVHKSDDGELGVIAVMIEKGKKNSAAQSVWDHLPKHAGEPQLHSNTIISANAFLPEDKSYYRFMGSLTTPPCSEGVNWHVLKTPIQFSGAQIDAFKSLFSMNARPLQKQNKRLVVLDR